MKKNIYVKNKKTILILKVPQCEFVDQINVDPMSMRNFDPYPSLALGYLAAFIKNYADSDFNVIAKDINIIAYTNSEKVIDVSALPVIMESILKDEQAARRYLTMDQWKTKSAFDDYVSSYRDIFEQLSAENVKLSLLKRHLGWFVERED